MRARPLLAASAALALLGGAVAGPVAAAVDRTADAPAVGSATSTLTLLDLALGGEAVRVLELALGSDSTPATSFVVTPLTAGGTAYGRQTLSSRSAALPVVDTRSLAPAGLSAVAAVRTPRIDVLSEGGSSSAGAASLGEISVLGLPLTVNGTVRIGSAVDGARAMGEKTLTITDLALPSIADLLAARGLDLTALPVGSLVDLLDGLDLTSTSIEDLVTALEQVLAPVQPQVDAAEALVASTDDAVRSAAADLADAQAAQAAATTALNDATRTLTSPTGGLRTRGQLIGLPLPLPSPSPLPVVEAVVDVLPTLSPAPLPSPSLSPPPVVGDVVDAVTDPVTVVTDPLSPVVEELLEAPVLDALPPELVELYTEAKTAYDAVLADVTGAQVALDAALALLEDARAALQGLLAPYATQVGAVVDAVVGVLDTTPLVSLDRLEVTTRSTVTSAGDGGQTAEVVGGRVAGLRVLGTDVLDSVLGSSALDLPDLTSAVQGRLTTAITGLTGSLSQVLSAVPGLPGLSVPAPAVSLLRSATATDVVDGFGVAGSALRALTVTWPGLAVPAGAALPGAATLPGVTGLPVLGGALRVPTAGEVLSQPLTLGIATLEERARFKPGAQRVQVGADGSGSADGSGPETPGGGSSASGDPSLPPGGATSNPRSTPVGLTQLPQTGLGSPPLIALVLVGAALGLHRRYRTA